MEPKPVQFAAPEAASATRIQVAPLIDIVFLLICFYLLVAQLVSNQKDPTVQLPVMGAPEARQESPAEFVINLRRDGVVTVGGNPAPLPRLRAMLDEQLARAGKAGRSIRVVVRADRRQRYGRLDEVLATCRNAGVKQVVFRTLRKRGP